MTRSQWALARNRRPELDERRAEILRRLVREHKEGCDDPECTINTSLMLDVYWDLIGGYSDPDVSREFL